MKQLYVFLSLIIFVNCQANTPSKVNNNTTPNKVLPLAVLNTNAGSIHIEFYSNKAPKTVERITELIKSGFYEGIQFHRVIPNFVAQAGDPTGTGVGGSGKKINAEFNDSIHTKGTVAMARLGHDENSADSQFYIALSTLPHLDGKYTVFGKVVKGIELLDNVKKGDKIISFKMKEQNLRLFIVSFFVFDVDKLF